MLKRFSCLVLGALGFLYLSGFYSPVIPSQKKIKGDGLLILNNLHLGEKKVIRYKNLNGSYIPQAVFEINHLLRCRYTHKVHPMNLELLELVDHIQDHFGSQEVQVISAFRSPELNESLIQKGRKVAKNSLHKEGYAMDIRLPGVSTEELRSYSLSLKRGGVGFYPHDGFVHVDVGRVRQW